MDSKISIGIPIEVMLYVVGILESSGIIATIGPSRIEVGEIWLELNYISDSPHHVETLKQVSNVVNEWNRIKYGSSTAIDIYKKLGL